MRKTILGLAIAALLLVAPAMVSAQSSNPASPPHFAEVQPLIQQMLAATGGHPDSKVVIEYHEENGYILEKAGESVKDLTREFKTCKGTILKLKLRGNVLVTTTRNDDGAYFSANTNYTHVTGTTSDGSQYVVQQSAMIGVDYHGSVRSMTTTSITGKNLAYTGTTGFVIPGGGGTQVMFPPINNC